MNYSNSVDILKKCDILTNAPEFIRESSLIILGNKDEWSLVGRGLQIGQILTVIAAGFAVTLCMLFFIIKNNDSYLYLLFPTVTTGIIVLLEYYCANKRKKIGNLINLINNNLVINNGLCLHLEEVVSLFEITFENDIRPSDSNKKISVNPDFARTALGLLICSDKNYKLIVICYVQIPSGFPFLTKRISDLLEIPAFRFSTN